VIYAMYVFKASKRYPDSLCYKCSSVNNVVLPLSCFRLLRQWDGNVKSAVRPIDLQHFITARHERRNIF